jgi:hypothetical protein
MDGDGTFPGAGDPASGRTTGDAAARPAPEDPDRALVRLYLELRRGMEEFRRVYGLSSAPAPAEEPSVESLLQSVRDPSTSTAARRELEAGIQAIKLHTAALLEAYQEAAQDGARRILETVDPEQLRREFEGAKIRLGPLSVPCRWRPLLIQAIWEEQLARFRRYRSLEAADFERFFRDGFRKGYRRFLDARSPRPDGENPVDS